MTAAEDRPQKGRSPEDREDVIYGVQITPPERLKTHLRRTIGLLHLNRRSPMVPAPGEPIHLLVTTAGAASIDAVRCRYRIGRLPALTIDLEAADVVWDDLAWEYVRIWRGTIPPQVSGALLTYRIAGRRAGTSRWIYADNQAENPADATVFSVSTDIHPVPAWAFGARIYQIFLDRFNPGSDRHWLSARGLNDFYGGTLQGVIEKLDYLQSLRINAIWLSPVFASPSHHGYDSTDLMTVEPRFGTNADLERLIREVHNRGMRILLDFVPNHWSDQHPTFQHARAHSDSPFRDWYLWKSWPDEFESYFNVRTMPRLNLKAGSPARAHLLDVARFWLQKGVDGYRLDHAEGPAHDFWAEFRQACLQVNPEAWLFGEIVRPPNYLKSFEGALHGCLDFALARALRETFALKNWPLSRLDGFLRNHFDYFSPSFVSPAFLDNHDMTRFLFLAGEEESRLRLGALLLFALPGPPILYYGTERGISQERAIRDGIGLDEARLPVDWEDHRHETLVAYFAQLGRLRETGGDWSSKARRLLLLDDDAGLLAYQFGEGGEQVVVAINTGETSRAVTLEISFDQPVDLLNGQEVTGVDQKIQVILRPGTGAWITSVEMAGRVG